MKNFIATIGFVLLSLVILRSQNQVGPAVQFAGDTWTINAADNKVLHNGNWLGYNPPWELTGQFGKKFAVCGDEFYLQTIVDSWVRFNKDEKWFQFPTEFTSDPCITTPPLVTKTIDIVPFDFLNNAGELRGLDPLLEELKTSYQRYSYNKHIIAFNNKPNVTVRNVNETRPGFWLMEVRELSHYVFPQTTLFITDKKQFENATMGPVMFASMTNTELVHNYGHTFGWFESIGYLCSENGKFVTRRIAACTDSYYSDPHSIMGARANRANQTLPAFLRYKENWIPEANVRVFPKEINTLINLASLDDSVNDVQYIRVNVGTFENTGKPAFLDIEYRKELGVRGLHIYYNLDKNSYGANRLLDMSPDSNFMESHLVVGETYNDPSGVRIKLVSIGSQGALIGINQ